MHGEGEQRRAVAAVARARSLPRQMTGPRLGATSVGRRVRELVRFAAALRARARGAQAMVQQGMRGVAADAGRAVAEGAGKAGRSTLMAQAAGGRPWVKVERASVSGRRQTETREGAAGEGSEHEGGSRGNASTIGKGASARSAEGRASASTLG